MVPAIKRQLALPAILGLAAVLTAAGTTPPAFARPSQTDVCGEISGTTVWDAAGSPYNVTCPSAIPEGASLTINAGAEVRFAPSVGLTVRGALAIAGSSPSDILLTTSEPEPAKGQWRGITINEGAPEASLAGFTMRYAGHLQPAINTSVPTTVSNARIENVDDDGIQFRNTDGTVTGTTIVDATGAGIKATTDSMGNNLEITGNTFEDSEAAVSVDSDVQLTLSGNSATGNELNGVEITSAIDHPSIWRGNDLPYVATHSISVNADLTIERGTYIKSAQGASIDIYHGHLQIAPGDGRVVFTALGDDQCADTGGRVDCDTDNDGNTPQDPGAWTRLHITSDGDTAELVDTDVLYADSSAVSVDGVASARISGVKIAYGAGIALNINRVPVSVVGSTFENNGGNAVDVTATDPLSITLQNSTFVNNRGAVADIPADTDLITGGNTDGDASNDINGYVVAGSMTRAKTWRSGDLPYVVQGRLELTAAAAVLTLEPGLLLKMGERARIDVSGGRLLVGTAEGAPVLITALSDDACSVDQASGCDTNGDGGITAPEPGFWYGITVQKESAGAVFRKAALRYGGQGSGTGGMVTIQHAASSLENTEIAFSQNSGVLIDRVNSTIHGTSIHDNRADGILIRALAAGPIIDLSGNTLADNEGAAINTDANAQLELDETNVASGNGLNGIVMTDDVLDNRTWHKSSLPYVVDDRVNVLNSKTLTIEPGAVVKFTSGHEMQTERGILVAEGTAADPVIFTSVNDDSVLGETAKNSPRPSSGDWTGLTFSPDGGDGSRLIHTELRYAGADGDPSVAIKRPGIEIRNSSITDGGGVGILVDDVPKGASDEVTITDNVIEGHNTHGIEMIARTGATHPTIQNNRIAGTRDAMRIDANVQPEMGGNTVENNEINGIVVHGNMSFRRAWGAVEMPWVIEGTLRLQTSSRLEIEAGAIVKAMEKASISVDRGTLEVPKAGSGTDAVIFTSVRDDSACPVGNTCDTDGSGSTEPPPLPGDWDGIAANRDAFPMFLTNVKVFYAGSNSTAVSIEAPRSQLVGSEIAYSGSSGVTVKNANDVEVVNNLIRDNRDVGLELTGDAGVTATGNILTGNDRSMVNNARGKIVTADNVAIGNQFDAMAYCADIDTDQVWESDLARELTCSVDVNTGVLVIEPGSLINFQGARGLRIDRGALEAEGAVFAGIEPGSLPGFWAGITFGENSSGYVRHSTLFASGGSHGAIETSSGQANVLYDTFLRMSRTALSVRGRTRDANVEGNLFGDIPGTNGATITVTDPDASPTIRYNQITGVDTGVSVRDGLPNINFNTFRSVRNNGITSSNSSRPCVNGRQNWWGAPSGPYDVKDEGRQNCGPQINEHGEGIPVGSNVNYDEWLTTPPPDAPLVDLPQCGVTNQTQQQVAGTTSSGARVLVFDGDNMAKELTADGAGRFASTIDLGPGQHRLSFEARGASDDLRSPRSGFRLVDVDPTLPVDPAGIRFEYGPVGSRRLQPIRDEAGCSTGCGGPSSGRVTLPPEGDCTPGSTCRSVAVIVHVPVTGSPSSVEFLQDGADPVALHQSGDEWVSGEFRPIQGPFRIGVNGADATECLGYVYPGGGGFVFADSGSPGDPIFFEDFENGMTRWSTDKWGIADRGHNSAHSATDSPDGTYMNEEDNSLYVPGVFDLRNVSAPVISFFEQHRLVRGDSARVEVRINNGSWRRLMTIEGTSGDWALQQISLDDYQRESKVELRFLLHSDRNGPNDDGWYVDDVSIGPGGAFNGRYDKDEPLVEDAEVTLLQRNPATGEWRTWDAGPTGQANPQRTDERGRFGFYNLPTGEYRIREDSRDYGPSQGAIVAVWNGTLDYQLPLAGSKPIYLPLMANSSRIN